MKIGQPVLYICGDDERVILNHIKQNYLHDYDILAPYDYQRKHLELIRDYIAPEYYKMCPAEESQSMTLNTIDNSPYRDYFIYFLICYLKEEPYYNRNRFLMWLNKEHPIYIKEQNFDVLKYYELKRYYQTIVMDIELMDGNFWNRVWGFAPNVFNHKAIIKIKEHLLEEGILTFININKRWGKVYDYTDDSFVDKGDGVFMKKKTPKNEFKLPRKGL